MKTEQIVSEAKRHKNKAIKLLKESQKIHEATRLGAVSESDAIDAAIALNRAAIEESEKAIALEDEYISRSGRIGHR